MVVFETFNMMVKRVHSRCCNHAGLAHAAAEHFSHAPCFSDERFAAEQQ